MTLPEYLANRFADTNGLLRALGASLILFFFLLYTASGLVAGGKLFQAVFGLPYLWAVALGALTILLYTAVGGFLAVSWTDVLQGLLMAAALLLVPLAALSLTGGADAAIARLQAVDPSLLSLLSTGEGTELGLVGILSLAAWGLGYFGQPHILARFQAIRTPATAIQARRIALTWAALTLAGAIATGLAGAALLDPPLLGAEREKVFIHLVDLLFHPVLAGICLAAILAAIMSTADSQLLVSSAAFTEDFYRRLVRREAKSRELVAVGRAAVVTLAGLAFLLALDPDAMVLDLVGYAWAGFGAAFGPVLLLSVYWPRMTRRGALAGILTGAITVLGWRQVPGGLFGLYELLPGFLLATLAIVVASLADPAPRTGLEREFARALALLPRAQRAARGTRGG